MKRFALLSTFLGVILLSLTACSHSLKDQVELSLSSATSSVTLAKVGGKQTVTFHWGVTNNSNEVLDSSGYELALLRAEENKSSQVVMKSIDFSVQAHKAALGDTPYLFDFSDPEGTFSVLLSLSRRDGDGFIPLRTVSLPFSLDRK